VGIWLWWESEWVAALLQYSDLAGAVHNRQFVGEAFFLSDRDHAPIIFFLCSVQQLDRLPEGDMALISRSKDAIQKARASQEANVAGVQG
jgi:hypothetical protein